jgi:hypothetical protein
MLTKKQLKQKARTLILSDGRDHQTVYDQLKIEKSTCSKEQIADILAQIPSKENVTRTSLLRLLFALSLIFLFLERTVMLFFDNELSANAALLDYLIIGIALPVLGIIGVYTSRKQLYNIVAAFSCIGLVELFRDFTLLSFLIDLPLIAAAIFGMMLYNKTQVPFTKKMVQRELQGRTVNVYEYFFEQSNQVELEYTEELLDA